MPRPTPLKELGWRKCTVWGVLNVTPDSFSDGGRFSRPELAEAHARRLVDEGADVIDIGGKSTRPKSDAYGDGFHDVNPEEEWNRLRAPLHRLGALPVHVSVDTSSGWVAARALEAGAVIVNDVSGGDDPELLRQVARHGAQVVLMHNRGRGERTGAHTAYANVVHDVLSELTLAVGRAVRAGVHPEHIWVDPGIGFAKTHEQSMEITRHIARLVELGHRVLFGASRKSFIAEHVRQQGMTAPAPMERLAGSLAAEWYAVERGVHGLRVHEPAATRQALLVAEGLR